MVVNKYVSKPCVGKFRQPVVHCVCRSSCRPVINTSTTASQSAEGHQRTDDRCSCCPCYFTLTHGRWPHGQCSVMAYWNHKKKVIITRRLVRLSTVPYFTGRPYSGVRVRVMATVFQGRKMSRTFMYPDTSASTVIHILKSGPTIS